MNDSVLWCMKIENFSLFDLHYRATYFCIDFSVCALYIFHLIVWVRVKTGIIIIIVRFHAEGLLN